MSRVSWLAASALLVALAAGLTWTIWLGYENRSIAYEIRGISTTERKVPQLLKVLMAATHTARVQYKRGGDVVYAETITAESAEAVHTAAAATKTYLDGLGTPVTIVWLT